MLSRKILILGCCSILASAASGEDDDAKPRTRGVTLPGHVILGKRRKKGFSLHVVVDADALASTHYYVFTR